MKSNIERLLEKTIKTESCWNWTGATWGNNGYGCLRFNGKTQSTHRISYVLYNGNILEGMVVMHTCDNPICVNPDHLKLGTQLENIQDRNNKKRTRNQNQDKMFCKRGHEFTMENTRLVKNGRQCKACDDIRAKDKWERIGCKNGKRIK
jgi:hypothetical protein